MFNSFVYILQGYARALVESNQGDKAVSIVKAAAARAPKTTVPVKATSAPPTKSES